MVEVGDLLAEDEVLEQRRPARRRAQRILVVGNYDSLCRGQRWALAACLVLAFPPAPVGDDRGDCVPLRDLAISNLGDGGKKRCVWSPLEVIADVGAGRRWASVNAPPGKYTTGCVLPI